ncbi:hypothetical protein [Paraburkholderia sacchari]|uniref:hypothetical protein n=1 Tax=Paraburkholderia sacchari TaxID=159450 RepID=UPI000542FCF5
MTDQTSRRAVIIGGSLGGLFTAASLRAVGWTVDVYERSISELDSRGGGLVMQPDLLEAFRFAGIAHAPQLGVPSRDRQYLDASGAVLLRQRMPQAQTAWSVLYNTLRTSACTRCHDARLKPHHARRRHAPGGTPTILRKTRLKWL